MQGFTKTGAQTPDKRAAADRSADFDEIYREFAALKAVEQAGRCAQCGVPFCQTQCPLQNNIPDWLRLTAEGRLEEAYALSASTNTFPEICGRICPQDRLCEGACVLEQSGHGTVTIGAIERYLTETAFEKGWVRLRMPARQRSASIGIVGAGPAGLAAAEMLRAQGYAVHVYDRYDRAGGLLVYGIPGFKLDKAVVARREDLLRSQGIVFHLGQDIRDLQALRTRHNAILIACGVYKANALTLPGAGLSGVVPALAYLTAANRQALGTAAPEEKALDGAGKNVAVIGGGDTAMDCVRTAIRQGARAVTCLYRRDRDNMPGSAREVKNAEEEGVRFEWLASPVALTGDAPGPVRSVRARRMTLGEMDRTGRRTPREIDGSDFTIAADLVIKALGFVPENLQEGLNAPELRVTPWGTVSVDPLTKATSIPGVFAAGDIVRGASLVVWAIRDGREAAAGIHAFLEASASNNLAAAE